MSRDTSRPRARGGVTSRSLVADLEALGWNVDYRQSSQIARTLEALAGELAGLVTLMDANRSVPTDREGRSGVLASQMPMPSFDAPAAYRELYESEGRLWREYERLAGVVSRPTRAREKCSSCGKRERLVDEFCGPCGARILREHRRDK
jgi:hypothetical protein